MSRKLMLVGLAVFIAMSSVFAVACGGGDSEEAKAEMRDALTVVMADMDALTAQMMATTTDAGAAVKAAIAGVETDWTAVVDAAENLDSVDADEAQEIWDDLVTAVNGLADDADLVTLAGALMGDEGPVTAIQAYIVELADLVDMDTTTAE